MFDLGLSRAADALLPPPKGKKVLIYPGGLTPDIVREVLNCFRVSSSQVKMLAPYFNTGELPGTCAKIWQFLKDNIRYQVDPEDVQWVKEPARTWKDKFCDCKSYAIFAASLLKECGIQGAFRFVSFDADKPQPTHVYVVVKYQGRTISIDPVTSGFNKQKPYAYKNDYPMTAIYRVSGFPKERAKARISLQTLDNVDAAAHVGDIFFGVKKYLGGQKAANLLTQISPAFLYRYIPSSHFPGAPDILSKMPVIVQQKWNLTSQLQQFVHDHWGYTWAELAKTTIRQNLTDLLGMDPQEYLGKVIGYGISSPPKVYGFFSSGQTGGNVINSAVSLIPGGSIATTALSVVKSLFTGLVNYNIVPDPATVAPNPSDWAGFTTALPIGRYPITPADPLGALGTASNSIAPSSYNLPNSSSYNLPNSSEQGTMTPYNGQPSMLNNNLLNPTPVQSGMSPLLMAGIAAGGIALVWGMSKGKKK